jgi:hypothetical protein
MKIFNEICLSIQLPSNNNDVSTFTLPPPHLKSTYWVHFLCLWRKISLVRQIMIEFVWGYSPILWHFFND